MPTPALATKLYIPPPRAKTVLRPRLIERLNEGLHRKLTIISAPAGFGKTTVLSEWIPKSPRCVTWLSLDEADKDETRFWTYFIYSLQGLRSDLGIAALALLQSSQATSITSILTILINDITTFPDTFAMVLDDYHVIDSKTVDNGLTFLLKHLPNQIHLVIATREDPNLPLARLRARDQLNELRAADLRFNPGEASLFLNQVMELSLSSEEIKSLEVRTEGWIAGLHLAALSMQGRQDVHGFIKAFAGDNRYIVDYLVEEVLERQTECVRTFLLQTSILDRLSGPLCNAVTGQDDCNVLLESLEQGNLFIVPLDDKRHWFRYHQLFADVLKAHLIEEQSDQIPTLHRRASAWYEQNSLISEAVHHALVAREIDRAADLIELAWPAMEKSRQSAKWLSWIKQLPEKLILLRPVLSVDYAWALLDQGKLEAGEAKLKDAERWLNITVNEKVQLKATSAEMIVADNGEFQFLPSTIASARAYLALALGDVPATIKYARQALDLLPKGDHLRRGTPASLLALASWACGDLDTAEQSLADAMLSFQQAGNILFAITGAFHLADIQLTLGRLRQAFNTYHQSLQLAAEQGKSVLWGTADLHTGLSDLLRERNNLEGAAEHLLTSKELGEQSALARWRFRWCITQARVQESQGELNRALVLLDEAKRHYVRGPVPDVRPITALKTRVWIRQGRLSEALGWAREQGLSPNDDLNFPHEFEHITLARILIAHFRNEGADTSIQHAIELLERLLKSAEEGNRIGSVIEILMLQALAFQAQNNKQHAHKSLERALRLAEPEGYVRIFVDEGLPIAQLLSEIIPRGIMTDYASELLAIIMEEKQEHRDRSDLHIVQPLIDPLSQREIDVLRLIAQGLSNQEISDRLFLALPTVKGYNHTIYNKLQVHRRTEAVARARELDLL